MSPTTTSVDLDELVRMHSEDECPIDKRWKQYLMVPPDGGNDGKAERFTRVTTVAKTLDDGFGVSNWARRLTAVGFAQNPILFAELCATDPGDKGALDDLCEKAKSKAGGDDAADVGKVLHAFSEKVDRGQQIYMPDTYRADIEAYQKVLADLGVEILPEYIERYICLPGIDGFTNGGVGGRFDRIVGFGSRLMMGDVKTGTLADYSWLPIAIQLALYSRAPTIYNPKTKSHEPMPDVDQDTGLVFHVPAGQARCDVYFVDLNFGWEAAEIALAVRRLRQRKDIAEMHAADRPVADVEIRRQRLVERIAALKKISGGVEALVTLWPKGVAGFRQSSSHTADELDLIALAVSTAENRVQAPFGPLDPADAISSQTNGTKEPT